MSCHILISYTQFELSPDELTVDELSLHPKNTNLKSHQVAKLGCFYRSRKRTLHFFGLSGFWTEAQNKES